MHINIEKVSVFLKIEEYRQLEKCGSEDLNRYLENNSDLIPSSTESFYSIEINTDYSFENEEIELAKLIRDIPNSPMLILDPIEKLEELVCDY